MRLNNGDRFPSVSGPTVGGGSLTIPVDSSLIDGILHETQLMRRLIAF